MKIKTLNIKIDFDFDLDFKFIALLPALNINLHSKSLEFEWLILGVYIDFSKPSRDIFQIGYLHWDSIDDKIAKL